MARSRASWRCRSAPSSRGCASRWASSVRRCEVSSDAPAPPSHHPSEARLLDYASGALPEPPALLVATHLALCPACRRAVAELEAVGGALLDLAPPAPLADGRLERTLARLDEQAPWRPPAPAARRAATSLPQPLRGYLGDSLDCLPWRRLGPIAEVRLLPDFPGFTTRLLWARAGAAVPAHTHHGSELTLVLRGGFCRRVRAVRLRRRRGGRRQRRPSPGRRRRRGLHLPRGDRCAPAADQPRRPPAQPVPADLTVGGATPGYAPRVPLDKARAVLQVAAFDRARAEGAVATIWITGASSGIGRALALRLARDGHEIAASARSADKLERLSEESRATEGRIHPYPLDVEDLPPWPRRSTRSSASSAASTARCSRPAPGSSRTRQPL